LGATYLYANPRFHDRTKHIEVDFHFGEERVASKELQIRFLCAKDQCVDGLTKPLSQALFQRHQFNLNLATAPLILRGLSSDKILAIMKASTQSQLSNDTIEIQGAVKRQDPIDYILPLSVMC
jgi:hypothetical protein